MELSHEIVSQFAKVINETKQQNTESIVYGTVKTGDNGNKYVQLDGSDQLTPLSDNEQPSLDFTTATANEGDRVTVLIKNHTATIIGNLSSPAASSDDVKNVEDQVTEIQKFDIIIAGQVQTNEAYIKALQTDKANIGDLKAAEAKITELETGKASIVELNSAKAEITDLKTTKLDADIADIKYATIANLETTNAEVHNLDADLGNFKVLTAEQFTATEAYLKELDADKLSAKDIEGKYANIDFSNISKATMESFYATSGLIENVVIGDATISGRLVGVVISGDLIEGGTVKADKLVIQGTDGLYYKLNTDGITTEAEQTEYNSLNGGILAKKSITASKIDVEDLVAFGAKIGGFVIADNSIYSGVKESIDNTTGGIYLDKEGQAYFGDASDFLKCYKDQKGDYKLVISADSILVGSDKRNVGTVIGDIEVDVEEVHAKAVAAQSAADEAKTNAEASQAAATKAQKAADEAKQMADDAQSTADEAQNTADTAKTNAEVAQSTADEAKQVANNAQKAADDADAELAKARADLAIAQQNLTDVTSRVDATEEEIEAAQAAVITAQAKADEAATNATNAQSTADEAKTNANNAQKAADEANAKVVQAQSAANEAQSTANTAKANAEAAQTAANNAQSTADTAKANAATAQKVADDAQADVDALTNRVTTAETQIDQNSEAIKLRATKTEVDERLNGYYSKSQTDALLKVESDKIAANVTEIDALGTRMSTVEQTADGLTVRLANTEDELENLEIGGRNLLRHTGDLPITYNLATGISSYGTVKPLTDTGEGVKFIVPEGGKGGINIPLVYDSAVQNGEEITISFDYRGNMTDLGSFYFLQRTSPNVSVNTFPDAIVSEEEWQHYTYTFSSNYANDRTCYAVLLFYTGSTEAGKWIEIKKGSLKLERGNKSTDWTPAEEDVKSDITDAAKTATNFMKFSDTGLVIADMTGDELGNNVLIDTDSVDIRSGDVVLASYGASRTSLGKGNKYSVIDMCDEALQIYVNASGGDYYDWAMIDSSVPLGISSSENCTIYSEYMDYNNRYGAAKIVVKSCELEGGPTSLLGCNGQISLFTSHKTRYYSTDGNLIGDTYARSRIDLEESGISIITQDYGTHERFCRIEMGASDSRRIDIEAQEGVYINGRAVNDSIIERGNNNGWEYCLYGSGVAECWYHYTGTVDASFNNYSGFYYSPSIVVDLPMNFTFTSIFDYQVNGGSMDRINFARHFGIYPDIRQAIFVICGHQSGATNVAIDVYISVKGKYDRSVG